MEAVADLQPVSSPKKSRRSVQKRVVSVPVADGDGGRSKGGGEAAPPSDSWAWRKYGQKPIKGSPYPRGYYRCSSSKGCPARKQVERSRADPTTFIVTYSADHDHSWPATAKTHRRHHNSPAETTGDISPPQSDNSKPREAESNPVSSDNSLSTDLMVDESAEFMIADSFGWFAQVSSPSSTSPAAAAVSDGELFCSSLFGFDDNDKLGGAAVDEEEESLFAGLGELPECSIVFRRGFGERRWSGEEDGKRCGIEADESAASWFGSSR
ncbi:probable WRKY transcription factor 65 [Phalaenopsis equestris]|uniref:probable WRKY transcription factor 65 n=1 Tax=Phalaenopsis equestris TaxID=78828 RepID=UPI0009E42348|nr:probable WRKY transcription factor 65 [Phalaenopsis equestris]